MDGCPKRLITSPVVFVIHKHQGCVTRHKSPALSGTKRTYISTDRRKLTKA